MSRKIVGDDGKKCTLLQLTFITNLGEISGMDEFIPGLSNLHAHAPSSGTLNKQSLPQNLVTGILGHTRNIVPCMHSFRVLQDVLYPKEPQLPKSSLSHS